jgi:uncharacterized protein (TIGR02266 family)
MKEGGGQRVSRPRQKRVDINLEFDSLERLTEYVSNISKSGCFIRAQEPWPVGTKLNLRFTVLLEDPEILDGIGEVVRVSDDPRGMGVKFVQVSAAGQRVIERVLQTQKAKRRASP